MRIVVYTALFGNKDRLWSVPPVSMRGATYVVFTERQRREVGLWSQGRNRPTILEGTGKTSSPVPTWEQRVVKITHDNRRTARYCKVMAHEVLPEFDISIWIDGNIRLLLPPREAVKRWLRKRDLAAFKHPDRQCLFQEAEACMEWRKGDKRRIATQVDAYQKAGMPRNWGLASTRCVIRRHTGQIVKLNEAWWKEIKMHSVRDQVSLPYVCWKARTRWGVIPGKALHHREFWWIPHGGMP